MRARLAAQQSDASERQVETAWVNDVYSYHKQSLAGDSLNLIAVLAREHGLSVEEAFRSAAELYNENLELFESTARRIRGRSPSSVVSSYLDALAAWIHGNYAWTGPCRRYR